MKNGLNWYKRNPVAYLGGVQGMTTKQHAVYSVVLDLIYQHGGSVNNDPSWIAGWFSDMGAASVRNTISSLIDLGKLHINGDQLTQKRAENETKTNRKRSENEPKPEQNQPIFPPFSDPKPNENKDLLGEIREEESREEKNNPPTPLDGGSCVITHKGKNLAGKLADQFDQFWDAFNYKTGKAQAASSWRDIAGYSDDLFAKIMAGAKREADRREELFGKGQTPKMAQGWITARRWEDEIVEPKGRHSENPEDFGVDADSEITVKIERVR